MIFTDIKERAIFSIAGFVGNTGNIGIPLGIALFGEQSVIYTTLINIANVFVVYIIGVYIYSRGSFSIKDSLFNIIKIPIIPASIIAIFININDIPLNTQVQEFFKMGAYAGIVLQLFLLGTFLYGIRIKELHPKLFIGTISQKFIIVPLATAVILSFTNLPLFVQGVIFMEMLTPLAVANINLASLYDCKPKDVTSLILLEYPAFYSYTFCVELCYKSLLFINDGVLLCFLHGVHLHSFRRVCNCTPRYNTHRNEYKTTPKMTNIPNLLLYQPNHV